MALMHRYYYRTFLLLLYWGQ